MYDLQRFHWKAALREEQACSHTGGLRGRNR